MSISITLPEHYGYVALAAISTGFLTLWQTTYVSAGRKKSGVKYPRLYAEKAEMDQSIEAVKYNCAQRAHGNTMEFIPHVLFFVSFLGLRRPILAASLGAAWNFSRVLYTLGYVTGDPAKRNTRGGFFGTLAYVGLILGAAHAGVEMAMGKW
ncbi:membrane-associated proteins in eicosanoid and glutathione metabolism [Ceratobasidium sp. AG-I]|nr:membrane-associated proteins in eicosanoid and glutathione metabolism [Ceratobasidium sp. AG-I]